MDAKSNFGHYQEFLQGEDRYYSLEKINKEHGKELLQANEEHAKERYQYYEERSEEKAA